MFCFTRKDSTKGYGVHVFMCAHVQFSPNMFLAQCAVPPIKVYKTSVR